MCEIRMTCQNSRQPREVKKAATETGFVTPLKVLTVKKFALFAYVFLFFLLATFLFYFFGLTSPLTLNLSASRVRKKTHSTQNSTQNFTDFQIAASNRQLKSLHAS